MTHYDHNIVEKKWQSYWCDKEIYRVFNDNNKPKYYILDMFPYPSGAGLHVGHPLGYIASDIFARYKRHKGFCVLHPMGYDAFGLPAEQYAIQTGQHPAKTTAENIMRYRKQLKRLGFSFDWSREIRTSDPDYYKWTQWIFIELYNSWYDKTEDKAKPISTLIKIFEREGNTYVQAHSDEEISFDADKWKGYSEKRQQEILLRYRLAYLSDTEVNWCPKLGSVLANDEVVNGFSERGGYPVERRKMLQWSLRITAYANRLLEGLNALDWSESIKESQRHWIGRSIGAKVNFEIKDFNGEIEVFTTRVDTIFGVSFITLAPEHELVEKGIATDIQRVAVDDYVIESGRRSDRDRMAEVNRVSGVFTGRYAIHPLSGKEIPIWLGDYVLAGYGTGAVMGVPCGDHRDHDFAKTYDLPIPNIFEGVDISEEPYDDKQNVCLKNSSSFDGLNHKEAVEAIVQALESKGKGDKTINYRLRDAVFSRQRYWGEPFPVYYREGMPYVIEKEYLPLELPEVQKFLPTEEGQPPLGNATHWAWDTDKNCVVDNEKIDHKSIFPLELNTMPGWAGSSWYFNRYMDTKNDNIFTSKEALNYWREVDIYIGGSEHATGHLLYSRFWQKFLYDRGFVPVDEYAKKLINQGMILGESAFIYRDRNTGVYHSAKRAKRYRADMVAVRVNVDIVNASDELDVEAFRQWLPEYKNAKFETEDDGKVFVNREVEKMSKSKYNVINPDTICDKYGADTLRLYEMFLGPLEQSKPWNTSGISGVYNFLKKLWRLYYNDNGLCINETSPTPEQIKTLHKTIKKVTEDIESFSLNTAVSTLMICVNELTSSGCHSRKILEPLTILISPYAPHIAEELWETLGHRESISAVDFPTWDESCLLDDEKEYPVSFNGKLRFKVLYSVNMSKLDIENNILKHPKTQEQLQGVTPKKIIVVPGKIINFVV